MKQMNHAEYQKNLKSKSVDELTYIIQDATDAANAAQGMQSSNEGYYRDEVHYCLAELRRRQTTIAKLMASPREQYLEELVDQLMCCANCKKTITKNFEVFCKRDNEFVEPNHKCGDGEWRVD